MAKPTGTITIPGCPSCDHWRQHDEMVAGETPNEPTFAPRIMDPDTALSRLFALDEAKLRIQQSLASVQVITRADSTPRLSWSETTRIMKQLYSDIKGHIVSK